MKSASPARISARGAFQSRLGSMLYSRVYRFGRVAAASREGVERFLCSIQSDCEAIMKIRERELGE
jgi:hypothetical protein